MSRCDLAIVGGGPAGLAAAIEAARRGLSVILIERQGATPDKACGEGLMPSGWRALEALGATRHLDPERLGRFEGIRYLQEDGSSVAASFSDGQGFGVRRLDLSAALRTVALQLGVEILSHTVATDVLWNDRCVTLRAGGIGIEAQLLIAADGLASPLRRQAGLEALPSAWRRFGLRRHFRNVSTSGFVDVHWTEGVEAYVTPIGGRRCGVAFLFDTTRLARPSFDSLLERFPALRAQLDGTTPDSETRGAGPFLHRVRSPVQGRLILMGDAAGYVDAITGEGLSLAFESAHALGKVLPEALRFPERLAAYARRYRQLFRRYAVPAHSLVWLGRHARLRRSVFGLCARHPLLFEQGLRIATTRADGPAVTPEFSRSADVRLG